jgi:hypothetical protein
MHGRGSAAAEMWALLYLSTLLVHHTYLFVVPCNAAFCDVFYEQQFLARILDVLKHDLGSNRK